MDLRNLNKLVKSIEKLSKEIIQKVIPYIEDLDDDYEELIETLMEKESDITSEESKKALTNVILCLTNDSEVVLKEIDIFSEKLVKGGLKKCNDCKFLKKVWYGDIYDKTELEGITELRKDLETQKKNINDEKIIEKAIDKIKNNFIK